MNARIDCFLSFKTLFFSPVYRPLPGGSGQFDPNEKTFPLRRPKGADPRRQPSIGDGILLAGLLFNNLKSLFQRTSLVTEGNGMRNVFLFEQVVENRKILFKQFIKLV